MDAVPPPGSEDDAPGGVRYRREGPLARVTLDRQRTRNALSADTLVALGRALADAVADRAVRLIVLDHAGPVFCSGADLRAAAGARAEEQPVVAIPALLQRIWACPKPLIAAIDGKARAGGVGLFAACDLTIATTRSDFATSEVRLGVIPAVISVPFLARVHPAAAREWFLTGAVFDAARAHRDGLVDVVTDDLAAMVAGYADALARGGPVAIAETKQLLRGSVTAEDLAQRYRALLTTSAALFASAEGQEGIAAMREKRPASWVPATQPPGTRPTAPTERSERSERSERFLPSEPSERSGRLEPSERKTEI